MDRYQTPDELIDDLLTLQGKAVARPEAQSGQKARRITAASRWITDDICRRTVPLPPGVVRRGGARGSGADRRHAHRRRGDAPALRAASGSRDG
ncbi:MAG: hypothetical protein U0736_11955 [Gemmataceae bacterium]